MTAFAATKYRPTSGSDTARAMSVMQDLPPGEWITSADLAERIGIEWRDVHGSLNYAVLMRAIDRAPDPKDRRRCVYRLPVEEQQPKKESPRVKTPITIELEQCAGTDAGPPHVGGILGQALHVTGAAAGEAVIPASMVPAGPAPAGYESLHAVLQRALAQASHGKGAERHAGGRPFDQQPMQHLIRLHGVGFATGQASKKAQESHRMTRARAVAELLGAINYLAGAVVAIEAGHTPHPKD